ncbi:hypothetical protein [Streptomyces cupreus]|nr:hypothetical protein [Streptomyces cupreus]
MHILEQTLPELSHTVSHAPVDRDEASALQYFFATNGRWSP